MDRPSQIAFLLAGILLAHLPACSGRDEVVNVEATDSEMTAAIAKLCEAFPEFRQIMAGP